jgi:hypothetical protein
VFGWDSANQFFSDCVNPDINKSDTRPVLLAYKIGNFLTYSLRPENDVAPVDSSRSN